MKNATVIFIILIFTVVIGFYLKNNLSSESNNSTDTDKLKVVFSYVKTHQLASIVASEEGFFKKYNLKVEMEKVDKNVNTVLIGGKADMAVGAPSTFLTASIEGAELSWVGTAANDHHAVLISNKPLQEIKVVGTQSGVSRLLTINALKNLGIDTKSITFQDTGSLQAKYGAFVEKKIDAIFTPESDWLIFKKKANNREEFITLANSEVDESLQIPSTIIVRNSFLKEKRKAVENFAKAIIEADNWIIKHPKETSKDLVKNSPELSEEDASIYVNSYIPAVKNLKFAPSKEKVKSLLGLLQAENPKAKDFTEEKFISSEIASSLQKSGFLSQFGF
ncbi:MAG: ABC transporter substrate-binding protein [Patescibacteria group bacterium]|nr:ABC transporter substrate-binding protein [Patescibacteria group bacterium]MCL5411544.1 ABC transporter substrate-binding protein [Patescibacteria group bacterium]